MENLKKGQALWDGQGRGKGAHLVDNKYRINWEPRKAGLGID
jgi:hypothetical protein